MTTPHELFYRIALTQIPEVGNIISKNLIAYCGSAEAVFLSSKSKLKKIPQIGEFRAEKIFNSLQNKETLEVAETEMGFIEKHKIQALFFTDKQYPKRLQHCEDAPTMVYYKGNANLNTEKTIAVVGTRNATEYGKEVTKKIIEELTNAGILVLSGLAYGIDSIAHQAAVENNIATIGILAHGLNKIYPEKNKNLAKQMVLNGGLLTEYTTQCNFHPGNFPERNRIVAGMSDAVLVIESDVKGGAVITANIASSYNRDVFAVPGKVSDKYSRGCNFLIKTYKAILIENANDLLYAMNWEVKENKPQNKPKQLHLVISGNEKIVYDLLLLGEKTVDILLAESNLKAGELSATLLEMEMNGWLISLPGKRYKLRQG